MIDVVQRGSVQPDRTLYLGTKCSKIEETQLNLDHPLRPRPLRSWPGTSFGPSFHFAAPDPQQPVEGERGTGGSEHEKEPCKPEEGVAAVGDEQVPLVN